MTGSAHGVPVEIEFSPGRAVIRFLGVLAGLSASSAMRGQRHVVGRWAAAFDVRVCVKLGWLPNFPL